MNCYETYRLRRDAKLSIEWQLCTLGAYMFIIWPNPVLLYRISTCMNLGRAISYSLFLIYIAKFLFQRPKLTTH